MGKSKATKPKAPRQPRKARRSVHDHEEAPTVCSNQDCPGYKEAEQYNESEGCYCNRVPNVAKKVAAAAARALALAGAIERESEPASEDTQLPPSRQHGTRNAHFDSDAMIMGPAAGYSRQPSNDQAMHSEGSVGEADMRNDDAPSSDAAATANGDTLGAAALQAMSQAQSDANLAGEEPRQDDEDKLGAFRGFAREGTAKPDPGRDKTSITTNPALGGCPEAKKLGLKNQHWAYNAMYTWLGGNVSTYRPSKAITKKELGEIEHRAVECYRNGIENIRRAITTLDHKVNNDEINRCILVFTAFHLQETGDLQDNVFVSRQLADGSLQKKTIEEAIGKIADIAQGERARQGIKVTRKLEKLEEINQRLNAQKDREAERANAAEGRACALELQLRELQAREAERQAELGALARAQGITWPL